MRLDYPLHLQNPQMPYAWGSKDGLQQLFGIPCQDNKPQAEVWMGAHPKAPSIVTTCDGKTYPLNHLITEEPLQITGKETGDLPFLFKLLSAETPLSIQVHPNKQQAEEGYNRENMEEIPVDSPHRNYRDNNHKPELIYALTPFKAMCGFRPMHEIQYHLNLLIDEGVKLPHYLADFRETTEELRLIFVWMLSMIDEEKASLIDQVTAVCKKYADTPVFNAVLNLYQHYPNDSAILAPFWLNLVDLNPGEALFLDAGCPHAYLHGTGMEIMACSDNVLRGGLTPKYIDVSELSEITCFAPNDLSIIMPERTAGGDLKTFPVSVNDFSFMQLTVKQPWQRRAGTVHIAFCMKGEVTVKGGDQSVMLTQGQSCLLPAACTAYINGNGTLALAGDGKHSHPETFFHPG